MSARQGLTLPERSPGFQCFHHVTTGIESITPVRRPDGNQYDGFIASDASNPVYYEGIYQCPAMPGFGFDTGQKLFGHARVVLEEHIDYAFTLAEIPEGATKEQVAPKRRPD